MLAGTCPAALAVMVLARECPILTRDDKPIDIRQTCRAGFDSRDAKRVSRHIKTFAEAPPNMTADGCMVTQVLFPKIGFSMEEGTRAE